MTFFLIIFFSLIAQIGFARNEVTYRTEGDSFAKDSGLNPNSLGPILRTLSDWPEGYAVPLPAKNSTEKPLPIETENRVLLLNSILKSPITFPQNLPDHEVQFIIPRELFLLGVGNGFLRLIERFEDEQMQHDRIKTLELLAPYVVKKSKDEIAEISDQEVNDLLNDLIKTEEAKK